MLSKFSLSLNSLVSPALSNIKLHLSHSYLGTEKDHYLQIEKLKVDVHVLSKKAKIASEFNYTSGYSQHHTSRQFN